MTPATLIYAHLGKTPGDNPLAQEFHGDLGADSLDVIGVVIKLEETLNIEITDRELEALGGDCTVGDLCRLVEGKVA